MESITVEKKILTQKLITSVTDSLKEYAEYYPHSQLQVNDVREVMAQIIDYLDIVDITGFKPWEH